MSKISNREKILAEGLKLVHARGLAGASVRDIVQAAGVPQGSFTNHFASKEAFGLEVLERYSAGSAEVIGRTLSNRDLPPLARLAAFIDASACPDRCGDMRNGCLVGNLGAELQDESEAIRARLFKILVETERSIEACLRDAVAAGELPETFETAEVAAFILASLQGAILMAKIQRSTGPVRRLNAILTSQVLR